MKSQKSKPSASMFEAIRPLDATDRSGAPLADCLLVAAETEKSSFHMPGHNAGHAFVPGLAAQLFRADTTELSATDDLNDPAGPVKVAQRLAAAAFGASETWFLTGGSTQGIQALMYACCGHGGRLLIGAATHRSVLHTAALLDIKLEFIIHSDTQLQNRIVNDQVPEVSPLPVVTAAELTSALQALNRRGTLPDAVLVTSPDYYGEVADIAALAETAHRYNLPLLVDEAHGAHFFCAPAVLPPPALQGGADAVVQSAHKTLPALTPTALLHLGSGARTSDSVSVGPNDIKASLPAIQLEQQTRVPISMQSSSVAEMGKLDKKQSLQPHTADSRLVQKNDHAITPLIASQRIREGIMLFRTSSPSLMAAATIDLARNYMEKDGFKGVTAQLQGIAWLHNHLDPSYRVTTATAPVKSVLDGEKRKSHDCDLQKERFSANDTFTVYSAFRQRDPLRLIIDTRRVMPAHRLADHLARRGIRVEMADLCRLVLIVSLFTEPHQMETLAEVLNYFATGIENESGRSNCCLTKSISNNFINHKISSDTMHEKRESLFVEADRTLIQAWFRRHITVRPQLLLRDHG
ncbi:MAG TPA: hypothetical protein GX717_07930, partial [Clostridiaceae bacterium]|nr:hypothetical protein [Clostridiaceae bacterium]